MKDKNYQSPRGLKALMMTSSYYTSAIRRDDVQVKIDSPCEASDLRYLAKKLNKLARKMEAKDAAKGIDLECL